LSASPPIPTRSITVNGTQLPVFEQGTGDPVVFVHGALGDYRSWLEVATALSSDYRVVTYSRRAHFPNPWPEDYDACDPAVHAADMATLIEALELGPVHLVAHSIGGVAALVMATNRPDLVRTLVLGEPPLLPWLGGTTEGETLLAAFAADASLPAQDAFRRGNPEEGVRRFLDGVLGEGAFDRIPPDVRGPLLDNASELGVQIATPPEVLFSSLRPQNLNNLRAPALLLQGEYSPRMFWLVNASLQSALPQAEMAHIPGVSHDLSNPPVVVEAIRGFLQRHGAPEGKSG
jgi:non-heme chloroperoxidase